MSDTEKTKEISVPVTDDTLPVIMNVQETGYFRVNYDDQNWKLIIDQLNEDHEQIHVINRAQIIDDAMNLAQDRKSTRLTPVTSRSRMPSSA